MSLDLVRQVLETRLATLLPALPTAWENTDLSPTVSAPYQAVTLLPAQPSNPVYGPGYVEQGLLQVTLCYPINAGSGAAAARAESIRALFPRGLALPKGGVTTQVSDTPEIMQGAIVENVYQLPVRVRWFATVGL